MLRVNKLSSSKWNKCSWFFAFKSFKLKVSLTKRYSTVGAKIEFAVGWFDFMVPAKSFHKVVMPDKVEIKTNPANKAHDTDYGH